ncbi:MAG: metalloregulator ArsR/SmtB family transcription factor [Pseudomonadota bacterium]
MTSDLDAIFSALAHPSRREILARLAKGKATVNELADPIKMSLPAVSRHIRVLEEAGLIDRSRKAQFRPCRLKPDALVEIENWTAQYRHIWANRLDAMEQTLARMKDGKDD